MKNFIFVSITFSRLWKSEFRDLVNTVVEILKAHNPEELDLKFVYNQLMEAQASLQALHIQYRKDPNTEIIKENRNQLSILIAALVAQIRVLKRANAVYTIPQLNQIAPFVERYLKPIVTSNSVKKSDTLNEMFLVLEGDSSLTEAITNLNLTEYFNELKALQNNFIKNVQLRSKSRSSRNVLLTGEVKEQSKRTLTKVLNEIEIMQLKHPELDYNPLINNLNDTFTSYMSLVKARATSKKTSKMNESNVSTIQMTTTAQNGNSDAVAS